MVPAEGRSKQEWSPKNRGLASGGVDLSTPRIEQSVGRRAARRLLETVDHFTHFKVVRSALAVFQYLWYRHANITRISCKHHA